MTMICAMKNASQRCLTGTMADLIAQGPLRQNRWRRPLPAAESVLLGRSEGTWTVPWDNRVSRVHAALNWQPPRLHVVVDSEATNAIFYQGQPQRSFALVPGEHFVIGATTFTLSDEQAKVSLSLPHPVTEQVYPAEYLRELAFRDARQQITALSRLPELIAGADSDQELCVRLVNLLLTGISQARDVAVACCPSGDPPPAEIEILHWDRAAAAAESFQPSGQLIREALRQRHSVVHVWESSGTLPDAISQDPCAWAFCTPVPGSSCRGWTIYVAGIKRPEDHDFTPPDDLQDALKFVELAATTVGSVCDVRQLQRRTTALGQFFSPPVREAVVAGDLETALAPRETDVAVLFCDLRGFSRKSESQSHDLLGLLHRVSESLGTMTRLILEHGGVIGDFHGDAAMGFWGWPLPQPDLATRSCRAALAIRAAFEEAAVDEQHALAGFRVGMGLATGRAVAGKIGTVDQVKVTAFGPVVNLAARLEGITKTFGTPILIDRSTAQAVQQHLSAAEARVRLLAEVRPYGLQQEIPVYELLPGTSAVLASDEYELALTAFRRGDWQQARALLEPLAASDAAARFLLRFMAGHGDRTPEGWDGIIPLANK